jgi:S-adenosylmethionine hydrolase
VVSIDRFGNVELALLPAVLDEVGLPPTGPAEVRAHRGPSVPARRVMAFAELGEGELGLLVDSSGRLALVCNRASAATCLGLGGTGAEVSIRLPDVGSE